VPFEDGLRLELEAAVHLTGTPDFAEGLAAFVDKRPPRWA
jgi:enoyl-CoA hydratase/carnithine racemase